MDFKFLKNIKAEDAEKNYYEFLFRRMFKQLLIRKKLWKSITLLEQGETCKICLYECVYMKIYKLSNKNNSFISISGGIYDSEKKIYYYFIFHDEKTKFKLIVESPINKYVGIKDEIVYISSDKKDIYSELENDFLTWS